MTPAEFIAKWGPGGPAATLSERSGAQPYFMDLCALLGVPTPGSAGDYLFEQHALVLGEARGYADVFYRNRFAWENKAPGKNLDAALRQLQQYSLALGNPPLLVVCDRLIIRIHTQFNGHPSETHLIRLPDLADPAKQQLLRRVWLDPESFRPHQTTRTITEAAARSFATLAEQLRARGHGADQVAHFLTQCLFCFFAEDVALLPGRMFERLIDNRNRSSEQLTDGLRNLFQTMRAGGSFGADDIPWFNGGLFQHIDVPPLEPTAIAELRNAAQMNWSAIDVSIFGTLFERGLDPAKRSQLGAHYTDPATIARIIDPVITRPLLRQWEQAAQELQALTAKIKRHGDAAYKKAHGRFIQWLETLRAFRILDPACGSGNFLFLGLKALKDVELLTITQAAGLGLDREQDLVTGPHNLLGIEINEYAAELARVSIWIGEIQWRMAHGYPPKTTPVLEPLEQIECRDALLAWPGEGADRRATEAAWPQADVVVGNPPFLGGIIGGEPGVEYVFAPTHDSGATVNGTKLCPLCCGTGYTGNVNDREACERCEGSGIDGYAGKLAALEAERASSRAEVENLKEVAILDSRKLDEARAEVEALTGKVRLLEAGRDDRDARILSLSNCAHGLSAQVERLKEHVTVLESGRDNSREKFVHFEGEVGRLTTETDYLRSMAKAYQDTAVERAERIAALEAVIAAQGEQAVAMSRNFHATLKVQEALNAAGLDAKVSLTSNCIEETP